MRRSAHAFGAAASLCLALLPSAAAQVVKVQVNAGGSAGTAGTMGAGVSPAFAAETLTPISGPSIGGFLPPTLSLIPNKLAPVGGISLGSLRASPEGTSFVAVTPNGSSFQQAPLTSVPVLPRTSIPGVSPQVTERGPPARTVFGPSVQTSAVDQPLGTGKTAAAVSSPLSGKFAAVLERARRAVGERRSLPVEELLVDRDVLLLGESHGSVSSVRLLASNMESLKASGVTVIGIEGLKKPQQKAVDRYLSGEVDTVPEEAVAFSPRRRDEFTALLEAARAHGVRVVALGLPLGTWAKVVAKLAARNTGEPESRFGTDLVDQQGRADKDFEPGFNEAVAETILRRRNRYMAGRLASETKEGGKAVALVGDAHVAHPEALAYPLYSLSLAPYGDLAGELARLARKAFSVTLTGGLFVDAWEGTANRTLLRAAYRLVGELSPDGRQAFYPTSDDTGLLHLGGSGVGRQQVDLLATAS